MVSSTLATEIDDFILKLKRRQLEGSIHIARKTTELLRHVVSSQVRCTSNSLQEAIRQVGKQLIAAKPSELSVSNMVRRVLHFIREETQQQQADKDHDAYEDDEPGVPADAAQDGQQAVGSVESVSLTQLSRARSLASLLDKDKEVKHTHADGRRLKTQVIEAINELIDELDGIRSQIAEQGSEHIHTSEVVLTFGGSNTVYAFLKEAAKKRQFSTVVAEAAPGFRGHQMAKRLAALPNIVQTTVITDAAIFAMMARVNMVVVGARAVLANGGIMGSVGLNSVALAAQRHSVPFVVLTGLHKLSPEQPFDPEITMNDLKSPADVVDFEALAEWTSDSCTSQLHVANPAYDYVPPHLISLFITDSGGHAPSYVYRLLAEYYHADDNAL